MTRHGTFYFDSSVANRRTVLQIPRTLFTLLDGKVLEICIGKRFTREIVIIISTDGSYRSLEIYVILSRIKLLYFIALFAQSSLSFVRRSLMHRKRNRDEGNSTPSGSQFPSSGCDSEFRAQITRLGLDSSPRWRTI